MKYFKTFLNFYINSSIHVALAVFALTYITLFQFNVLPDVACLLFVFFASISGYNFVKYFGLAKFHHRRLSSSLRIIQVFSGFAFIAMCYYMIKLSANTLILIALFALITFLYAVPFLPKRVLFDEQQNLRQISGLKIYVIAAVWGGVTVVLPLVNNYITFSADSYITLVQRFLFVLVLMLPFEIRDLNYDNLKLATIPQKIGISKTKIMGVFVLFLFLVLEFFKDEIKEEELLVLFLISFVTLFFLLFSRKIQSKYYTAFWVESIPIMWLGLLLVFR